MTQHELAVALGSGDAMKVSRWERGEHLPSSESLVALATVLGREPAWFYEIEEVAA
jgi:transcriptional regulator with XRE-family HTH domain